MEVRDSGTGGGRPACATPRFFNLVPGSTEAVSAWGACPYTSGAPPLYEQGTRTRCRRPYRRRWSHMALRPCMRRERRTRFRRPRGQRWSPARALRPQARQSGAAILRRRGLSRLRKCAFGRQWAGSLREGPARLESMDLPSPDGVGEWSRDPWKRRWRLSLEPRACARAVGMGWGVESSGGSRGFPWVFGSSLRWV